MEQDERLRFSFGAAAAAYAEHRPDYARAAVRWALERAPGPRVLDLGAGTGKLTAVMAALGADVIAVEPDPAMLAELRRALPDVRALPGRAEAIPLPDASVDAVLVGHALHWFDMAVAGPEIARVLVPGGILAGLWNVFDDRFDWVAGLERVSGSAAIGPRDTLSSWRAETADAHLPGLGHLARFGSPEQAEFPHGHRRTAERGCWSCQDRIERSSEYLCRTGRGFALRDQAISVPVLVRAQCARGRRRGEPAGDLRREESAARCRARNRLVWSFDRNDRGQITAPFMDIWPLPPEAQG